MKGSGCLNSNIFNAHLTFLFALFANQVIRIANDLSSRKRSCYDGFSIKAGVTVRHVSEDVLLYYLA